MVLLEIDFVNASQSSHNDNRDVIMIIIDLNIQLTIDVIFFLNNNRDMIMVIVDLSMQMIIMNVERKLFSCKNKI